MPYADLTADGFGHKHEGDRKNAINYQTLTETGHSTIETLYLLYFTTLLLCL